MNTAVMGAGSWGIALAIGLVENGHHVTLWSRSDLVGEISKSRVNPRFPGVKIPENILLTDSLSAVEDADLIVLAPASYSLKEYLGKIRGLIEPDTVIACASKGIDADTGERFSELAGHMLFSDVRFVTLSGPTHAEEVAKKIPTACVAASRDSASAKLVQRAFMSEAFRVYTSADIIGVETGAALKNIIALCAGICDGLEFGDNTIAALCTRGLHEISSLVTALGGRRETVFGLAGVGDLIVTCTSRHSRNRRAGVLIGQGMTSKDAMEKVGAVVEGYYAAAAARLLSKKTGIEMPISAAAYDVLFNNAPPREMIRNLMLRAAKDEM